MIEVGHHIEGEVRRDGGELGVGLLDQQLQLAHPVGHKNRLIDLHNHLLIELGDRSQEVLVATENIIEIPKRRLFAVAFLGIGDQGQRADEIDLGGDPQRFGFGVFAGDLLDRDRAWRRMVEDGDDVVVVGIEPLGHLKCLVGGIPPRHRKIAFGIVGDIEILSGLQPQGDDHIQRGVVKRKIVDADRIDPGFFLIVQVACAQGRCGGLDLFEIRFSAPVALKDKFEFASLPDTGKSGYIGFHGVIPFLQNSRLSHATSGRYSRCGQA